MPLVPPKLRQTLILGENGDKMGTIVILFEMFSRDKK